MPEPYKTDLKLSPDQEMFFQAWYKDIANRYGLNPDPDNPQHYYFYRRAWKSGFTPDLEKHWPSIFKHPKHPNRYVNGIDTITGKKLE